MKSLEKCLQKDLDWLPSSEKQKIFNATNFHIRNPRGDKPIMTKKTLYKSTTISPERTKADIDKMLKDFGITNRAWITKDGEDVLLFEWVIDVSGVQKHIAFELRPPEIRETKRVWNQKTSRTEKLNVRNEAIAYRLLLNYIKNKLEVIRVGMVSVENEFMAHIKFSLKDGTSTTLGQRFIPLLTSNRLENALEYKETQAAPPRNVTNEKMIDL